MLSRKTGSKHHLQGCHVVTCQNHVDGLCPSAPLSPSILSVTTILLSYFKTSPTSAYCCCERSGTSQTSPAYLLSSGADSIVIRFQQKLDPVRHKHSICLSIAVHSFIPTHPTKSTIDSVQMLPSVLAQPALGVARRRILSRACSTRKYHILH
ncbi:8e95eb38-43c9-43c8-ac15-86a5d1d6006a [Sclerotinia trifoliorum]|uniref:8e95eb38-43c9-43c8-ac15-86a5d1d6006a n=1 Tax=Sclerotinia trifoliorum TaxID=28548 RepID=A0A8H2VWE3_9HELO|nr:8e95eb38-43c9-43c8-ac15-86a5d1d6006a [Sclerotinia trifoliorum]